MRTPGEIERALKLNEKAAQFFKTEFQKAGMPDHLAAQQGPMLAALTALTVLRWVAGVDTGDAKAFHVQLDEMDKVLSEKGTFASEG